MGVWKRRHCFIGNFSEDTPLYWLFQREGAILLSKLERRLVVFLFMSKTMLAVGWSFILWSKL